jgi:ketosteroid isomerase-like protein
MAHDELLKQFFRHHDAEQTEDVDRTMATVTDDIVYEHPFREPDHYVDGAAAVRAYYERHLHVRKFTDFRVVRTWTGEHDTLLLQYEVAFTTADGRNATSPGFVIVTFRDGNVSREIIYNGPVWPVES